ncbi:MAG: ComEC/Rec2 family competence protein [Chlamydiae bacterium]|jgi:competence protein ComEC|nr:ComEC/Rec2 family competence protein [Chlamydiota bacterium]
MISGISLAYGVWPPFFFILFGSHFIQKVGFTLIAVFACFETVYFMPITPETQTFGIGYFHLERVKKSENSICYQGVFKSFISQNQVFYDLPTSFFRKELLPNSSDYIITGTVKPNQLHSYTLYPSTFEKVPYTTNLCHKRYALKEKFRRLIKTYVKDEICASFFSSLATGEIENRLLSAQFSKVGLTHTLAISGFHYTTLICIIGAFFHLFLTKQKSSFLLLFIVSFYFLFIGETPSLNRAWIAAIIYLIGYLIKEPASGLNSLGIALTFALILNPFALFEVGFQLSYLATFGIVAIYPSIENFLRKFFPKRNKRRLDFLLSSFCRNSFALTFAVNLTTLPLILYHFHFFPYLSLFFNLFFPLVITIPMIALIISPIPWVGGFFLQLAEQFSNPFLHMIFYGVDAIDCGIWSSFISFDLLTAFLMAIPILGLYLDQNFLTRIMNER